MSLVLACAAVDLEAYVDTPVARYPA